MSDLGALLRKAREQRGYSLEDVQDATKIRKRYLEAIESGDYKVLPGSFYVRAFVKTYAETVGLDAEEVLRLYHKELPQPVSTETATAEPIRMKPKRRSVQHNDRWGKAAVTLLMWLFPILIAVVIYVYFYQNKEPNTDERDPGKITEETGSPTPSPSSSVIVTPPPTVSAAPTPSTTPVALTLTKTSKSIKYYDVANAEGAKLVIDVTAECWVQVSKKSVSGEKLLYRTIKEPETLTYDLTEPLYVSIGRSSNAAITIGGTPVDDGDKPTVSSKFLFTPVAATPQ